MIRHWLRRNADNEPVCACGYRPEILDEPTQAGKQWKAKTAVLEHAQALNKESERAGDRLVGYAQHFLGEQLAPWQETLLRRAAPDAPFVSTDRTRFPRAGVRPLPTGEWKITLWDEPDVVHVWEDEAAAIHPDSYTACTMGALIIDAHRQSRTRLNGMGA